ncbi:MAG: cytochrome ubiquinol oxidase subunit I [Acidobacteria bacterium]|nr:MAG: cytochrome ubiquinol oxidase subunit I [Acidobacteriota bacterium]
MDNLLAARMQMAISLMFHIIFAVVGIATPLMMFISEAAWLRTRNPVYLDLTKRWAKGTAIFFAVGAVSGTVLSFELGLLWPQFMEWAGPIIGMPFSLEGFAFFTEAIFLGLYLYGWNRVPPLAHLFAGLVVAVSGAASAVFVVTANAWMNTPRGFQLTADGKPINIDPIAAMLNPAAFPQVLHMVLAAYAAVGLAVAGIHAYVLLRHPGDRFHRAALTIALLVGGPAALLQPIAGDIAARTVAITQPAKLAAMEGQFETEAGAPLRIGGWPDRETRETRGAIEIPKGLSLLAFHDPNAVVKGLNDFPPELHPPVEIVHVSFQVMVACGTVMALVVLLAGILSLRERGVSENRLLLRALVLISPLGLVAIQAGWFVTEVGRQPWIIQGVMRTRDAVTPMPGLVVPMTLITFVYILLGVVVVVLLRQQVLSTTPSRVEEGGASSNA